jgi:outer membrane lipoprotein-sorting protein
MRWLPALPLLAAAAWPAAAQDNEAEKLFRAMEQKVRSARTVRLRFDLSMAGALGTKGNVKGTLLLGEGDKYRVEMDGTVFGQAVRGTEVSDGTRTAYRDAADPKRDSTEESAKAAGAYFRGTLPKWGFFLCSLNMRRSGDLTPDAFEMSDFKTSGEEKIGERNAHVIQYTFKEKGAKDPLSMTLWLDAETHLPAKLAITGGKSDWRAITETYGEFQIDAKVDAKQFELPK